MPCDKCTCDKCSKALELYVLHIYQNGEYYDTNTYQTKENFDKGLKTWNEGKEWSAYANTAMLECRAYYSK